MLILTRRVGESVVIGEDVTVTVLGVKGNQVRIGINAPKTWPCTGKKSSSGSRAGARPATAPATRNSDAARPTRNFARLRPILDAFLPEASPGLYDCAPRRDGRVVEGAPLLRA